MNGPPRCFYVYRARIERVVDGDSVVATLDFGFNLQREQMDLRLYGIDTPELRRRTSWLEDAGVPFEEQKRLGDAARRHLEDLLALTSLEVTVESHRDRSGKYGRVLATLWQETYERSIQARMVGTVEQVIAGDAYAIERWKD